MRLLERSRKVAGKYSTGIKSDMPGDNSLTMS